MTIQGGAPTTTIDSLPTTLGAVSGAAWTAKRDVERYWLRYTLVWGGAAGLVMLTSLAEKWTDVELMPFGVILGLGAIVPPMLRPPSDDERARPLHQRTATRLGLSVAAFAFLMNYFTTPYFFDVLHMHYGFHSRIVVRDNPVFLYFLTVAYFATYAALLLGALCIARRWGEKLPKPIAWVPVIAAPFVVAGLETALNANPFMKRLFCYDDAGFALTFGTLSYGACFCFTLPVWSSIDETRDARPSGAVIVARIAAATLGIVVTFAVLRAWVAPRVTVVHEDAPGLGYVEGSCLER